MNILFLSLGIYDSLDDRSIYTDLLKEFQINGHDIFVVTPREKNLRKKTHVTKNKGATFLKVRMGNIRNVNLIEKGISTITLEFLFLKAIKKHFKNITFDLVLYATPPITFSNVIEYIKKRDNASTYLMLKDIFPQNSVDLGMLKTSSLIYKYFKNKEKNLYKISDYIGCMSPANKKYIIEKNPEIPAGKVEILPNTITPNNDFEYRKFSSTIRIKYSIPTNKVIYVYGGNLGKPQGIDFLIECIKTNESNDNSFMLIIGSGTEYSKLKKIFEEFNFKNSKLLNNLPKDEYEKLLKSCDVGLIFLDYHFTIPNFPSRLLSYMDAEIPIIAATDTSTDVGTIIESGNFGFSCKSNDVNEFNQILLKLNDKNLRINMGKEAKKYLYSNYTSKISYQIINKHFN